MAKKKGNPLVRISKLRTNYKLTYDYNQRLSEFIKLIPKEHRNVRVENTIVNGKPKDEWSRIIAEVEMGKVMSFILDNAIEFVFEGVCEDDLNALRQEYKERQERIHQTLKLKADALDITNEDFSFLKQAPYDYQKQAVKFFEITQGLAILGDSAGVGKANLLTTLIATPEGWVKMGDIKIGQLICHQDGGSYPVTGIYPQGKQQSYKVTLNDDFSVECNMEHLWLVRDANRKRKGKGWTVKSLQEMISMGLADKFNEKVAASGRQRRLKWEIPIVQPIFYPEKDLLIEPYILGALIGDVCMTRSRFCLSIPDSQIKIKEII